MIVLQDLLMFLTIVDSGVIIKGGLIFIEATSMFKHVRRNSEMVIAVATVSFENSRS